MEACGVQKASKMKLSPGHLYREWAYLQWKCYHAIKYFLVTLLTKYMWPHLIDFGRIKRYFEHYTE